MGRSLPGPPPAWRRRLTRGTVAPPSAMSVMAARRLGGIFGACVYLVTAQGHADVPHLPWTATQAVDMAQLPYAPDSGKIAAAAARVDSKDFAGALRALAELEQPAAQLLVARAQRELGKLEAAEAALKKARAAPELAPLCTLEAGKLAWARGDGAATQALLLPMVLGPDKALAAQAVTTLVQALRDSNPAALVEHHPRLLMVLPKEDLDARSRLLEAKAQALDKLGQADAARACRLQRFLEEPVSSVTPELPPPGTQPTPEQLLARLEKLLEAHRNARVLKGLADLAEAGLTPEQLCRKHFAQGLAERKLRHYAGAEESLTWVGTHCQDEELVRRAAFLNAKVISIRDGLRAIDNIEAFATRYAGNSMVDDALFWAGDLYQRRGRDSEAAAYYARIETLPHDDQCGEARWRLAWMAYRRGEVEAAAKGFARLLLPDGCVTDRHDQARARYWLGRVHEQQGVKDQAQRDYQSTVDNDPVGFYAQQALPRLLKLQAATPPAMAVTIKHALAPDGIAAGMPLCPDYLAQDAAFGRGVAFLMAGLTPDAAAQFRAVVLPSQARVLADAHAEAQAMAGQPVTATPVPGLDHCGPSQGTLLLILLLDRSGAQHEAHWRLRTDFAAELSRMPTGREIILWRAAYPLAFRELIARAEKDSGLPPYFLQALAREESAFDPQAVSWAEACGLTQLVLASAQGAGRRLVPPVRVASIDALLDPALNVRLGGALIGSMVRHYAGNLGLALAAYNAGDEVAGTWWKRFAAQDFAIFAEEMTIQETRGYVKRVLRTYGVYRWLYSSALPTLPVEPVLPAKP